MGIRINKALGYGLTDVVTEPAGGAHRLADPRINADSPLLRYEDEATFKDYLAHLERPGEDGEVPLEAQLDAMQVRSLIKDKPSAALRHTVVHQGEFGLPNVLAVIPVLMLGEWRRYDDSIDWVEQSLRPDGQEHRVEVLDHGLYPYGGLWMDARTGHRLNERASLFRRVATSAKLGDLTPEDAEKTLALIGATVRYLGDSEPEHSTPIYTSPGEALERIVPWVPDDVRRLADFGDLFTDPDVWKQLRPMLYVWWS